MIVEKSSSAYFAQRLYNALWELDALKLAMASERMAEISVARKYMNEKGKRYEKAQKSALRADALANGILECESRIKRILKAFESVWGLYSGQPRSGEIVAEFLRSKGNLALLTKKFPKDDVNLALATWNRFLAVTESLAVQRRKKGISHYKEDNWWDI